MIHINGLHFDGLDNDDLNIDGLDNHDLNIDGLHIDGLNINGLYIDRLHIDGLDFGHRSFLSCKFSLSWCCFGDIFNF